MDRLEVFGQDGRELRGEAILDTAIDLFVYVAKYRILLAEASNADRSYMGTSALEPFSDYDENFDFLIDTYRFEATKAPLDEAIRHILRLFEELWPKIEAGAAIGEKQRLASDLTAAAEQLVGRMVSNWPDAANAFIDQELTAQDVNV